MHFSTKIKSAMGMAALFSASTLPGALGGVINSVLPLYGPSQVPYQASIQQNGEAKCSGAIIYNEYVITAAGCVAGGRADEFSVRVGSVNAAEGGQVVALSELLIHPLFVGDEGFYDIAILTLAEPLEFNENVGEVLLPSRNNPQAFPEGTKAKVSGYNGLSKDLDAALVTIWDRDDCAAHYADAGQPIANSTICAGYFSGLPGECHLDVGAPLVDLSTSLLVGLASSLYDCVSAGTPGVYTSLEWVHSWLYVAIGM